MWVEATVPSEKPHKHRREHLNFTQEGRSPVIKKLQQKKADCGSFPAEKVLEAYAYFNGGDLSEFLWLGVRGEMN